MASRIDKLETDLDRAVRLSKEVARIEVERDQAKERARGARKRACVDIAKMVRIIQEQIASSPHTQAMPSAWHDGAMHALHLVHQAASKSAAEAKAEG